MLSVISILGNPNFGGFTVALIIMAVKSNRFAMHAFCSCASFARSLASSLDRSISCVYKNEMSSSVVTIFVAATVADFVFFFLYLNVILP